ncbi:DUF6221 family protein [Streptomyces pilosus]|uniref:DUF6221 family protein n=1 Tax=Streptomyces pilosus TaxID=28893 RepID=UPI0036F9D449
MRSDGVADLASFLGARIDEDEAAAQSVMRDTGEGTTELRAQVLADVAAKRGVLRFVERMQQDAEHADFLVHGPAMIVLSATAIPLRHLAAAYAAHPDFRPEWVPNEEQVEPDPRFSRSGWA